jgi:RNA polymerase sigma-70 factor (ECF subfamily)
MDDPRSDEALMLAYQDGDAVAFEVLYGRWRGRLYRYLAHQLPERADELFQDVWLRVVKARTHYEVTARFSTWLFRIAHNRLMDEYRGRAREVVRLYEDPDDDPADALPAPVAEQPATLLERKELAGALLDAMAGLPAPQREAFLLVEEGGMSLEAVAAATGVGRETAKSRLRYALARLRQALAGLHEEGRDDHD